MRADIFGSNDGVCSCILQRSARLTLRLCAVCYVVHTADDANSIGFAPMLIAGRIDRRSTFRLSQHATRARIEAPGSGSRCSTIRATSRQSAPSTSASSRRRYEMRCYYCAHLNLLTLCPDGCHEIIGLSLSATGRTQAYFIAAMR
jgi:hypothetical protein